MSENSLKERLVELNDILKKGKWLDPEERNEVWKELQELVEQDHIPTYKGGLMSEYYVCSCGWESNAFWDGIDFAMEEWRRHVLKEYDCIEGEDERLYERDKARRQLEIIKPTR